MQPTVFKSWKKNKFWLESVSKGRLSTHIFLTLRNQTCSHAKLSVKWNSNFANFFQILKIVFLIKYFRKIQKEGIWTRPNKSPNIQYQDAAMKRMVHRYPDSDLKKPTIPAIIRIMAFRSQDYCF